MLPPSSDPRVQLAAAGPYTTAQLETALDALLDPVLSSRRTAEPLAAALADADRDAQDAVLRWTAVIARSNVELAFQFAAAAPGALAALDPQAMESWVLRALELYDREGLQRASEALRAPGDYGHEAASAAVEFTEVAPILQLFVRGLAGRPLRVECAPRAYTDTETIFLPPRVASAATAEQNFLVYKATAALLWAQNRYGTYNVDLHEACAGFPDPDRALALLNALETVRLDAQIARTLPGLARDIQPLQSICSDARCRRLLAEGATIADALAVLREVHDAPPDLHSIYPSVLDPAAAGTVRGRRITREKEALQRALADVLEREGDGESVAFAIEQLSDTRDDGEARYALVVDGEEIALPEAASELIDSIVQDLGEVPADYLARPAPGEAACESEVPADVPGDVPTFVYDEWDCFRGHYRKGWCTVREMVVEEGDPAFIEQTLTRHRGTIRSLRRSFELLRDEERVLRKQPDGDGIDLDALVEAYADARAGTEVSPLVFTRRHRIERDLAVMFMVDMSGSTKGWINDAERQALLTLCEALEALGDRYAIYGFSGLTRRRCEVYKVKHFEERYGELVRQRISGMEPQDYTRMGAAIRHVSMLLNKVEARTRLLITLSDGKPDDYSDEYRGEYGIEDTRKALLEAHVSGIRPFCITIDHEARDYLPHMYGPVNWTFIDNVALLPARVAEIYRRLTA